MSSSVKNLKATSSAGGTILDQQMLYFQFKIYKKIKASVKWTSHLLFMESAVTSTLGYTPDTLFHETQSKYTTLLTEGLWQPSNKHLKSKCWQWWLNNTKLKRSSQKKQNPSLLEGVVAT